MTGPEVEEKTWHAATSDDVVRALETDVEQGLSAEEVRERLERYGPNRIATGQVEPWWRILLHQFTDPLIYILLIAAGVSLAFDEVVDAAVILFVVLLNAAIGFVQELRARKAIRALAEMSAPKSTVIRDGRRREIESDDVVPGDVLILAAGDRVSADARVIRLRNLSADESALTGEADAVAKQSEPVEDERAVPGDRLSMVFAGTNITRGSGRAVVVRTGTKSELGRIAEATHAVEHTTTPIQEKMARLGKAIGAAILVLAALIVGGGLLAGLDLDELIHTTVALAVGAVPEALPVVLTVTLAIGVRRMAARNSIIRSLPAVETLGSTTVIGSDKTGTLTANQMTVRAIRTAERRYEVSGTGYESDGRIRRSGEADASKQAAGRVQQAAGESPDAAGRATEANGEANDAGEDVASNAALHLTLLAGLLANDADELPSGDDAAGATRSDPTELALLASAAKGGLDPQETRAANARVDMIPFESERQFMATLNDTEDGRRVFLKGSPEAVIARCDRMLGEDGSELAFDADAMREHAAALADEGYRVLAMAARDAAGDALGADDPGDGFLFAGLQAMEDPLRDEVRDAVAQARNAGIRVVMLTGDHARTARAIGRQLGLGRDGEAEAHEGRELDDLDDEQLDELVREVDVFARVSPQHKLRMVQRLRAQGHIVAVTGDGVNDAPALRAAHLGIAMGRSGTDVAREASDMVLADDNFASITAAVEEGRVVFSNIRKVTYFLLSTGFGLVLAILGSFVAPWPLPFLAVQVLWINLATNGLQDVALAFEKGEAGLLDEPPRDPKEGVVNREVLIRLWWVGLHIGGATVAVFVWMLWRGEPVELARTVAMTQMVMFQFFHVLNARSFRRSVLSVPLTANPFLAVSLTLAVAAHLAAIYTPFMQRIFSTVPLSLEHWAIVIGVGATIIVTAEIDKVLIRRRYRADNG